MKSFKKNLLSHFCSLLTILFLFILPCHAFPALSDDSSLDESQEGITIKEIVIEGNRLIPFEKIISVVKSKVGDKFDKSTVIEDLEAIDSLGYFVRESIQAAPEITHEGVLLKIRIEENSPITGIQIIGNENINSEELLDITQDLIAKPESIVEISQVLDEIEKTYREKGFLLAKISNIEVDPDGILTIKLNEGLINKIVFKGNEKTKEKFLKRLTPNLMSGEIYNEVLLVQDLRALKDTGYFEDIQRNIEPSQENPEAFDLVIDLKEKRSTSFGFGGGVNTVSGAFGNIGINEGNFLGEGKKLSANAQLGTGVLTSAFNDNRFLARRRSLQLEARYTDPYFLNSNNTFSLFTNANTFSSYQVDLAQEKSYSLGTSFSRYLGMNTFGSLELIGENVNLEEYGNSALNFLEKQLVNVDNGKYIGELTEKNAFKPGQSINAHDKNILKENAHEIAKNIRKEQLQGGTFLNFNPSLTFDSRDNSLSPRKGWNNQLSFGQAVGIGNGSYTKLGVDFRRYIPVGKKTTLAFNLRGSSALLGEIPAYNQFRAGGYYGVRGYRPFSDLGIGSRSLLASAEIRTPFFDKIPGIKNSSFAENLKLVLFGDFGYVGGNSTINRLYNRLNVAASTGIGIRANLPFLGPIRVDYGIPIISPLWKNNNGIFGFGRFNFGFADRF